MRLARVVATVLSISILSGMVIGCATGIGGQRESAMEEIGSANKVLGAMAKTGAFDKADASEQAELIASTLETFKNLFPEGSQNADGAADAGIWTDRTGFETVRMTARDAALKVAAADDAASFASAYSTLSAACGSCHSKYRVDY